MKKTLLLLATLLGFFTAAQAADVTLPGSDGTDLKAWNSYKWDSRTCQNVEGYSISFTSGRVDETLIRLYSGASMTITAPEGKTFTKVVATATTGSNDNLSSCTVPSSDWEVTNSKTTGTKYVGTFTSKSGDGLKSITFKPDAQFRISTIVITEVDGGGETPALSVAAPTFTPATGTKLYADDKVTIACETEGAEITYTVNGGESQAYSAKGISFSKDGPYTIKATATLTQDGETATAEAEATYTYQIVKPKAIGAVQVTSNANIIEGAEYILAHKKTDGNFVVMGATIGNNAAGTKPYINHVDKVQPNDDESITVDRTSHGIISFESDEANGRWYLAVPKAGGYIKSMLNEARGRYCKFSENPEHSATVNINNEGKAEIIFKDGDNDAYFLANPGASRFTCYESATVDNTFTPALYALPAEDMSFSVVGPDGAEVSSTIDIENYKNAATGNYYNITVSYPKGTALYYKTTSYHMMVNGVDVLKPIVVDDKEIIPVLGEFKLAPKAEAAAAAASVAAESGMNTAVIGLASKGDFELRLQDAAGNVSEGKSYKINGNATGVEDIAVDGVEDGEAVYYNMQGVRVANPAAGSLYIRVQGSKAAKVLVK